MKKKIEWRIYLLIMFNKVVCNLLCGEWGSLLNIIKNVMIYFFFGLYIILGGLVVNRLIDIFKILRYILIRYMY